LRGVPVRHRKLKLRLKSFVVELQSFFSPQAIAVQPAAMAGKFAD